MPRREEYHTGNRHERRAGPDRTLSKITPQIRLVPRVEGQIDGRQKRKQHKREQPAGERKRRHPSREKARRHLSVHDPDPAGRKGAQHSTLEERRHDAGNAEGRAPMPTNRTRPRVVAAEDERRSA